MDTRQLTHPTPRQLAALALPRAKALADEPARQAPPAADAAADDSLPRQLREQTKYRIVRLLGRGGMGSVYEVHHQRMDRRQALKVINPELVDNPQALLRFEQELKAVAKLDHPNIARAYDAESFGSLQAIVMEFVPGQTLHDLLKKRGRLGVKDACRCVRQACLGLQHAHERGLVHRDLKPQNLMLAQDSGVIKILDFGLAKVVSENKAAHGLTKTNMTMGTYEYSAPEQAMDAASADIRADIYSLGCTLYYLIAGVLPFDYHSDAKLLLAHQNEAPRPLGEICPETPAELSDLVDRMLAKKPADRPQTPAEVAKALVPFTKGVSTAPAIPTSGEPRAPTVDPGLADLFAEIQQGVRPSGATAKERVSPRKPSGQGVKASVSPLLSSGEGQGVRAWFGRFRKRGFLVAAAAALFALLLCGVLFMMRTPDGTLVVESDDPNVQVAVKQGGEVVEVVDARSGWKLSLKSGQYELAPQGSTDQFQLDRDSVTVRRGDVVKVKLTLKRDSQISNSKSQVPNLKSPIPPLAVAPFGEEKAKEYQAVWAQQLGVPVEITNSIGMKMVLIPPGEFMMGSPKELIEEELKTPGIDPWYKDRLPGEGPQHRVRITRPFYLGTYLVTQGEYQRVLGANPSEFSATGLHKDSVAGQDTKRFPVECVSWDHAVEFCRKLSEMPEERSARRTYQLPSEAQWEYACRAGSTGRYGFSVGGRAVPKQYDENGLSDYGWFHGNSAGMPHAVGLKRPSSWGLYDMHGSLWEWCQDWYDKDYYTYTPMDDPAGPPGALDRVARGGSWSWDSAGCCRSASRAGPGLRGNIEGFRVSLVPADTTGKPMESTAVTSQEKTGEVVASPPAIQNHKSEISAPPLAVAPFDEKKAEEHQAAWAKHLGTPVEFANSIGMKLVLIPPGEFQMGSPKELIEEELKTPVVQWYRSTLPGEGPQHRVRITRPFYLGTYLVTQEEYQRVMGKNPSRFSATGWHKDKVAGLDTKRFPVESVSRDDAVDFCNRLTEMREERAAGRTYRLPSEAQWEYACRAGNMGRYGFSLGGNTILKESDENELSNYGWFKDNSGGRPHPVGLKRPSAWGLYDMHGNLWEWCQDWCDGGYYAKSPTDDPAGPSKGPDRVDRGGCWGSAARQCRSAVRYMDPGYWPDGRGFRVSLVLPNTAAERAKMARATDAAQPAGGSPAPRADSKSEISNPESKTPPPAVAPFHEKKAKEHQEAWAKCLNVPVVQTNSIGMKLVLIPPGEFQMGSPKELIEEDLKRPNNDPNDPWYKDRLPGEGPQHRVRITRPFYFGVYLVTQQEYQRVMGANPSEFSGKGKDKVAGQDTKRFPVENVSWDDAVEFCRKLSEMPEERAAGRVYQLPSEAQWEYACCAGNTGRYGFSLGGKAVPREYDENELSDYGWFKGNSAGMPHAVGLKRPSAWGLYDMHGNVWEWCQDWYDKHYYTNTPTDDPAGQ